MLSMLRVERQRLRAVFWLQRSWLAVVHILTMPQPDDLAQADFAVTRTLLSTDDWECRDEAGGSVAIIDVDLAASGGHDGSDDGEAKAGAAGFE